MHNKAINFIMQILLYHSSNQVLVHPLGLEPRQPILKVWCLIPFWLQMQFYLSCSPNGNRTHFPPLKAEYIASNVLKPQLLLSLQRIEGGQCLLFMFFIFFIIFIFLSGLKDSNLYRAAACHPVCQLTYYPNCYYFILFVE